MGLGCVKTRRRGKLIARISFQIAISATRNFSARSILSRSEKAILLVLECAGFSHGQGQKRPKLPWLPAAKSSTEQTVNFVPKAVIPGRWQSASAAVAVPVMRHSRANATSLIVIVFSFVLVPAVRSLGVPDAGSGRCLRAAKPFVETDAAKACLAQRHERVLLDPTAGISGLGFLILPHRSGPT